MYKHFQIQEQWHTIRYPRVISGTWSLIDYDRQYICQRVLVPKERIILLVRTRVIVCKSSLTY